MGDSLPQVEPVDVGVFADHEVALLAIPSAFTDQVLVREAPRVHGCTGAVVEVETVGHPEWLAVLPCPARSPFHVIPLPVPCDEVGEGDQQHFRAAAAAAQRGSADQPWRCFLSGGLGERLGVAAAAQASRQQSIRLHRCGHVRALRHCDAFAAGVHARWVAGQGLCHSPHATQPSLDS